MIDPVIYKFLSALFVVCSVIHCCSAQNCDVVIPLNVVTTNGSVVRGLVPEQLQVKIRGQYAEIKSLSVDVSPRRIVLLLDTSGSMGQGATEASNLIPTLGSSVLETFP